MLKGILHHFKFVNWWYCFCFDVTNSTWFNLQRKNREITWVNLFSAGFSYSEPLCVDHPLFSLVTSSVCRFKSLSYYRHLAASPSIGRADSWGVTFHRRQLSALQTMEMPLDGDKYDWLLNLQTLVTSEGWKIQIIGAKIDAAPT